MDTPIRLKCTDMALQKPFLGRIPDDLLAMVCKVDGRSPFIHHAICMVLGHEFFKNNKRYRVSTDITSRFLASLLDLGGRKIDMLMLLRNVFKQTFLEDDVKIMVLAEQLPGPGIGIPFADVADKCWDEGIECIVHKHPFLLGMNERQLTRHRKWARLGRDFLRKWLLLDDDVSETDFTWLDEFSDIIFSNRFVADRTEDLSD